MTEYKRWYDYNSRSAKSIQIMLKFPTEIQAVICRGVKELAEKEFKMNELVNEYRSLGSEKVLAMYKSKQKKRDYDKNPLVHQAMNYLYLLSEENREFMSTHIINMMELSQDYLKTCKTYQADPSVHEMETITSTYVERGKDVARLVLKKLELTFIEKIKEKPVEQVLLPQGERIEGHNDDMKIV